MVQKRHRLLFDTPSGYGADGQNGHRSARWPTGFTPGMPTIPKGMAEMLLATFPFLQKVAQNALDRGKSRARVEGRQANGFHRAE